jgi:membrane associated rhomboid family serine protease
LTGLAAALAVVFVESVVVTYFIGTSRWCKEVVETYSLDPAPARASSRLKRRAFAVALAGMLTVVAVIALGAAADPATRRPNTQAWTDYHLAGAFAGVALIAWTYYAAWQTIAANQAIIEQILVEVSRIRRERGPEPLTMAAN